MNERQEIILETLLNNYLKTALPVGSETIAKESKLSVSSATIRNELAVLEDNGYIFQPHTSAGRVPTLRAYQWLSNNLQLEDLENGVAQKIVQELRSLGEEDLKQTAKTLAEISGLAVFWAFQQHNLYYTGLANLLQNPEFSKFDLLRDISGIIDSLDEIINSVFKKIKYGPQIIVGDDNPFGNFCGVVLTKYNSQFGDGIVGILGPVRMDYAQNIKIINFLHQKVNKEKNND